MSSVVDLTNNIERLEVFEDRSGVRLEALYCSQQRGDDGDYRLSLSGEIHCSDGTELESDISLTLAIYDERGRVIETSEVTFFQSDFFGFDVFSFYEVLGNEKATRIRLFPKHS
jgi:hypothetical protein